MNHWKTSLAASVALALLGAPTQASAQRNDSDDPDAVPVMEIEAGRLDGSISIDGRIDEAEWRSAAPASGFITREPVEGEIAEEQTEVRVLFDESAIYVSARMHDSDAAAIADQLVRRDAGGQFDYFQFALDPNLDQRTGYVFQVSAANVQRDMYIYDDERTDEAWNAVWASAVSRDDRGWSVEMRIPLSQIRYEASDDIQTWGVNFARRRVASNEESHYAPISRLRRGLASQFGLMQGVDVSAPSRRIEARPYVLSSAHTGPSEDGDPFFDGSEGSARMGLDLRYGIGANFTLDATVSPDFGQVESDPAVINLSQFEVFQQERRPFFVEDARIFDFSLSGRQNSLFYSRRIGRSPQGRGPNGAAYTDRPDNATILGAAKFSGRTSSGLSIGVLGAVTEGEQGTAFFAEDGRLENFLIEPRTSHGVARLRQDLNGGMTQVGGIFTALKRDLPDDGAFDFLTDEAYSAGLDFEHQWGNRTWALSGFFAASHVRGDEAAIERVQRSSNHYFQRPDATRFELDPERTSLTGVEWRLNFNKQRGEHWTGGVWLGEVTNGFEINDLGFSRNAERLDAGFRVGYREIRPGSVFRNYNINFWSFQNWSHEALDDTWSASSWRDAHTSGRFSLNAGGQLLNWWGVNADVGYTPTTFSRSATRGGPIMMRPGSLNAGLRINSDRRKAVSVGANLNASSASMDNGSSFRTGVNVTFRPSPSVELRVQPNYSVESNGSQYVTSTSVMPFESTFGRRYVFANLDRQTVSMETRLNVSFTPTLTLELFAQPLLSSIDYVSYKQLEAARTFEFDDFEMGEFSRVGDDVFCVNGQSCVDGDTHHVDFDADGQADWSFSDRDFNQQSLIGNAVLRWEYRPGSTIFFVWQRSQFGRDESGDFAFGRDVDALFAAPADNRFIVKVNYWLGL